ncbi:endonuclease/exonuclease/phosphatase family protein [Thalassolituus sp. LLYu03]|uniref:endonuclease/exonuclease/phosphatase family protein n=1 Tax=Thalassolituus sp. LLYu03 TaxID=3421656 RepID=UPI003D275A85
MPFCSLEEFTGAPRPADTLRLLSFNIQVGIQTAAYHHYLSRSWQHLLPSEERDYSLNRIARLVQPFDIVALQEADAGSFRSRQCNQVEELAQQAGFSFWYQQVNRNLAGIARHSNGVLSRLAACQQEHHALPGLLPGRGLMVMRFGDGKQQLVVAVTHLALGKRTQFSQLDFLCDLVGDARHLVIMGDLNQEADVLLKHSPLRRLNLHSPRCFMPTYPSWRPSRGLDHILLSDGLELLRSAVIAHPHSDHLPVAAEIRWPPAAQA